MASMGQFSWRIQAPVAAGSETWSKMSIVALLISGLLAMTRGTVNATSTNTATKSARRLVIAIKRGLVVRKRRIISRAPNEVLEACFTSRHCLVLVDCWEFR